MSGDAEVIIVSGICYSEISYIFIINSGFLQSRLMAALTSSVLFINKKVASIGYSGFDAGHFNVSSLLQDFIGKSIQAVIYRLLYYVAK